MTDSESNVKVKLDICDLVVNSLTFVSFHHAPFLYLLVPSLCHCERSVAIFLLHCISMKTYYVYILSNYKRNVLYVGVTNDLLRRIWKDKKGVIDGFTKKYQVKFLIYYESTSDPTSAITREKQIKSWSRASKEKLILSMNPEKKDLYPLLFETV